MYYMCSRVRASLTVTASGPSVFTVHRPILLPWQRLLQEPIGSRDERRPAALLPVCRILTPIAMTTESDRALTWFLLGLWLARPSAALRLAGSCCVNKLGHAPSLNINGCVRQTQRRWMINEERIKYDKNNTRSDLRSNSSGPQRSKVKVLQPNEGLSD